MAIEPVQDEQSQEQPGADPADASDLLERVLERLEALEHTIAEFQQRSAHREAVIDRLYDHEGGRTATREGDRAAIWGAPIRGSS